MANAFVKAAAKSAPVESKSRKKETRWPVGPQPGQEGLSDAITELLRLNREAKALATRIELAKGPLKRHAESLYIRDFAAAGVEPERPLQLVNERGESVTFVVQDRATGTKVTDEMVAGLTDLLGEDALPGILFEQTLFGFDPAVMAQPCVGDTDTLVQDLVGEELGRLMERLVKSGRLSQGQADGLLTAETKRTFRPGLVDRLALVCGRSTTAIKELLDVVGGAIVRYIKC